jgi:short-subunit dehydrogenase
LDYTLITGATGGLGSQFANICAVRGENLILTARSIDKLNALKDYLLSINCQIDISIFACDMSDALSRKAFFDFIAGNNFNVVRLINVAGVDTQKAFELYDQNKLLFQTRVNLESIMDLTLFTIKRHSPENKLEILTISSLCGATPVPYFAVYSATKSALITFMSALRYEQRKNNVVITTVLPGSIPTRPDIIEDIKKQGLQGRLSKKSPTFVAKKSLDALFVRRKIYVPGFYNKIVYFFSKITPKSISQRVLSRKFSIKQKDAF